MLPSWKVTINLMFQNDTSCWQFKFSNRVCRYDINCRYKDYFRTWLSGVEVSATGLTLAASERAAAMLFPLPPFHHFMHNLLCQALNSYRR
jgi:hypothetical protein